MTNTLYTNDNLFILSGLNSDLVDLIYLDPPFNSKRTYSAPVGSKAAGASFDDMWTWEDVNDAYLEKMIEKYPAMVAFIQSIQEIHSKGMMAYILYMAQRIIEMHRILKETGSFYLHCDPTASHYLKLLLDEIFGRKNFRNEIIWKRKTSVGSITRMGKSHDIILSYAKNATLVAYYPIYTAYDPNYIKQQYRYEDDKGRYRIHELVANKALSGGGVRYSYKNYTPKIGWLMSKDKLLELERKNEIVWSKNGIPRRKLYLDENKGNPMHDTWDDINIVRGKESTGYPTQKPLALLERIIKASSKEGDIVFDPFCGCATTCVAAQKLGRKWIGVDIEKQAVNLLIERLEEEDGNIDDSKNKSLKFTAKGIDFMHTELIPQRTDVKIEDAGDKSVKERLFKEQNACCNACAVEMRILDFEVDHIVPKARGGGNYYENYQLLCGNCNRIKGVRPMEYLRMKIEVRERLTKHRFSFGE